jgi:hypothetical protein
MNQKTEELTCFEHCFEGYYCHVPYDLAVVPLVDALLFQSDGQRLMDM